MDLNMYVKKVYKYGLTPGFEKIDAKELVRNMRAEVEVLYKSLFQPGRIVHDNRLIAKNLANLFVTMCLVAKTYDIDLDAAVDKKLGMNRGEIKHVP